MTNEFDIIDNPLVLMWFKDYAKSDPLCVSFLTKGNYKLFKSMWGTPDGKTQNHEYWKKEHLGITIYVYSNNFSTFYKVQYLGEKNMFVQDKKIGSYITGFLMKLIKEILNG